MNFVEIAVIMSDCMKVKLSFEQIMASADTDEKKEERWADLRRRKSNN